MAWKMGQTQYASYGSTIHVAHIRSSLWGFIVSRILHGHLSNYYFLTCVSSYPMIGKGSWKLFTFFHEICSDLRGVSVSAFEGSIYIFLRILHRGSSAFESLSKNKLSAPETECVLCPDRSSQKRHSWLVKLSFNCSKSFFIWKSMLGTRTPRIFLMDLEVDGTIRLNCSDRVVSEFIICEKKRFALLPHLNL